jgi:hypothetical protein
MPPLPQSSLFTIPDSFKSTMDGKRFLLFDEARVRRERLLLFASDQQLDILFDSKVVFMDGTFSKTPPHFYQIYILHALKHEIGKKKIIFRDIFISVLKVYRVYSP